MLPSAPDRTAANGLSITSLVPQMPPVFRRKLKEAQQPVEPG
jgi:hypothetical protein